MEKTLRINFMIRDRMFGVLILVILCLQLQAQVPTYLKGYEKVWEGKSPKEASLEWFNDARLGMFVHFSPASFLERGILSFAKLDAKRSEENTQLEKLDRYSYMKNIYGRFEEFNPKLQELLKLFNPENFNADSIVGLAAKAGMKYITFTTQHINGRLFMFDTSVCKWNSVRTCHRDFVKELSDACQKRGLGLFLYVMPPNDLIQDKIEQMLKELLTNYGPIAGIWFDGIWSCYKRQNDFLEVARLYSFINNIQPQCLVSFKTGYVGDEDFLAAEWHQLKFDRNKELIFQGKVPDSERRVRILRKSISGLQWKNQSFSEVWNEELRYKPVQLSTTMIKGNKWFNDEKGIHKTVEEVLNEINYANKNNASYLLNIGPRKDGSIHPDDVKVLTELGRIINNN